MTPSPQGDERPFDANDPHQVGKFRLIAAGAIKDLLRARRKDDPAWKAEAAGAWKLGPDPTTSALGLLSSAARSFKKLCEEYIGYLDSVPCPAADDTESLSSNFEAARDAVLAFVDPEQVGEAASQLRDGKKISWSQLARWDQLREIRVLLDRLPSGEGVKSRCPNPLFDGIVLEEPRSIGYRDKPPQSVRPMVFRLVRYLTNSPNGAAKIEALAKPVFNEWAEKLSNDAIKSVIRDAVKCFLRLGAPFRVSRSGLIIKLVSTATEQSDVEEPRHR